MVIKDQLANFGLEPIKTIIPTTISKIQIPAAINKANGIKNSKLSTSEEKYSSNLYENPIVSLALISPEKIKRIPTINLEKKVKYFILFKFN